MNNFSLIMFDSFLINMSLVSFVKQTVDAVVTTIFMVIRCKQMPLVFSHP